MKHELKIWPAYFEAVSEGSKTFEVRNNDRAFQKGDTVEMLEWDPTTKETHRYTHSIELPRGYTGRKVGPFTIGFVLPLDKDRVVFSLIKTKVGGE